MANQEEILNQLKANGSVTVTTSDIQIGAVELKNGADDTRGIINAANTSRAATTPVVVTQSLDAAGTVQSLSVLVSALASISSQLATGLPVPISQWSNSRLQIAGTYTIVRSVPGLLRTVSFEALSCPSLTIYDNASGCSGTVIALMDAGLPAGNYLYDYSFANGMTISIQAGNTPCVRLTYK